MWRVLALLLLLVNGTYYAWHSGWLLDYGWGPQTQREPQRLAQQIHPEAIVILSDDELAALQASEAAQAKPQQPVCLMSPILDSAREQALGEVLKAALPDNTWVLEPVPIAARWIIYMGKYPNAADLAKKRLQLDAMKLPYDVLTDAALAPGYSLGKFDSQIAATTALEGLVARGVRTARVLQDRPAGQGVRLRLPAVDDKLMEKLPAVRAALAGQTLGACNGVAAQSP